MNTNKLTESQRQQNKINAFSTILQLMIEHIEKENKQNDNTKN